MIRKKTKPNKLMTYTFKKNEFTHEIKKKGSIVLKVKTKHDYLEDAIKSETRDAHEFFIYKQNIKQPVVRVTEKTNYFITHYE